MALILGMALTLAVVPELVGDWVMEMALALELKPELTLILELVQVFELDVALVWSWHKL